MSNDVLDQTTFNEQMLGFIGASPTPFHATANIAAAFDKAGFITLVEGEKWQLTPGNKYYFVRNNSSVIGFIYGTESLSASGIRMVGAHTDSPCLRVKPQPVINRHGFFQLGVEPYGGVLLNPWFDRDLSLAGRVTYADSKGVLHSCLIDFKRPIAIIPSLAIHLDREVNDNRKINAQKDLPPVVGMKHVALHQVGISQAGSKTDFNALLKKQIATQHPNAQVENILSHELSFYDTQAPGLVGINEEFIASARLDNLLSCFVGMQALCAADTRLSSLLICNDHEEVGSQSTSGASGPMLKDFIQRLLPDAETRQIVINKSLLVSADNAHGIHPNFSEKHEENHGPLLNRGPVIKVNANQRYATNSETSGLFQALATQANIPLQQFVTRSDMACGSTIGPLTATALGVPTLDVGVPTFAMHSIRELAGSADANYLYQVLLRFLGLDQLKI